MQLFRKILLSLLLMFILLTPTLAYAQDESEGIELQVVKIFGFRVANKLQGRIGLRVEGPEDLIRVEFFIDDEIINEDNEAPFRYDFNSSEVSLGDHTIRAIGYTKDGRSLLSTVETFTFLSPEDAVADVRRYILPLLIGVVVFLAMAGALSAAITRRKGPQFRIGDYGPAGGAVCRRCGMPFSRHIFSPNLVVGKLERCPNCGAVGVVRRGTPLELREAEERFLTGRQNRHGTPGEDEEERLRRMLDESRFDL